MSTMFETIQQFFDADEWYFVPLTGKTVLQMSYSGRNGRWPCYAQVDEEGEMFFFYSICPVTVPEPRRVAMAEFLTRANYGLRLGNFEMDFADGEIRYKTSIDVAEAELNRPLINNVVYTNVWAMDRYLPGIFAVTYGSASPTDAIQSIEAQ